MASRKIHVRFPEGTPSWAHWGRRVKIDGRYYRVGKVAEDGAVLWPERPEPVHPAETEETH